MRVVTRLLVTATLVTVLLSGCTTSTIATQGFSGLPAHTRILLMPPDIKYYLLTASGITEPQAQWTATARDNFSDAFEAFAGDSSFDFEVVASTDLSSTAVEYDRLHSAVGSTIIANHYGAVKLPSKKDAATSQYAFDWSLGSGVADLVDAGDADYALFVFFRDYQASGGRVGMAVFAAVLGASIYTGHQGGFASLVDLKSGKVVWFNNLPIIEGNMRSESGAQKIVDKLFTGLTAS